MFGPMKNNRGFRQTVSLPGKVAVHYDPFNLSEIQVWQDEKRYADAVPVGLKRKRRGQEEKTTTDALKTASEKLSFLVRIQQSLSTLGYEVPSRQE